MTSRASLSETSESEESTAMKVPTFAHFTPCKTEHMELFPAYPKSHINGYASIIELPSLIANVVERQLFGHSMIHCCSDNCSLGVRSTLHDPGDISSSPYRDTIQQL